MGNALYQVSESPLTTLTPSAASGTGVTFTAGSKVFNQTHVLASLTSGNASAVIQSIGGVVGRNDVVASNQVIANISPNAPFVANTAIAAGSWRISGADQKGLRCAESDDNSSTTIYAKSTWTTPNDTHQCSIFSKRIEFRMLNPNTALGPLGLIPKGGGRLLKGLFAAVADRVAVSAHRKTTRAFHVVPRSEGQSVLHRALGRGGGNNAKGPNAMHVA